VRELRSPRIVRNEETMNAALLPFLSALLCAVLAIPGSPAAAQQYPTRAIRVIVPFAPGGAADAVLRMLAPRLSANLGQQVVVDNRPGGASTIGMDIVAKSAPDGYTLGVASLSFAINPSLFSKMPYDTNRDFAPVSLLAIVPLVQTVHPSVPAKSVKDLIALAKTQPGSLNYSSAGNGSASQMASELFKYMTGSDMVHVPYTGGGPALIAVLSGQVSLTYISIPPGLAHFKSGKLLALGVTSAKRDPALPDVPTIAEAGVPGYQSLEWQGIVVPAGTSNAVINRLRQEIVKTLETPDLRERFVSVGAQAVGSTPDELAAHIKSELATWSKVIKAAGIHFD
jgi:tripartite-type tricarboxylate transporter receptor subunit TctC